MTPISSSHNPRIKQIRALRTRKERERTGQFFVEGIQVVAEAVRQRAAVETLVVAPDLLTSRFGCAVVEQARGAGVAYLEVTPAVLDSLTAKEASQGIAAVVRQRWERLDHIRFDDARCWVALEGVQYPGNLGTILRTSDAVGGAGAILLGPTADPFDPTAVRASTGAIFGQRLVRASLDEFAAWKRCWGVRVIGTSPAAPADYRAARYAPPVVLALGSEGDGLSADLRALCDLTVRIPMVGRGDSLNLAIAAGLVLYELYRQQQPFEITME
jgi:RNA methyltransferase, TrmH family